VNSAGTPQRRAQRKADLCRRAVPGRRTARERTVFKSVGNTLEDLAVAMPVWRQFG
jgi:ornithine cyclodeaminase/alanine dehydrogenase-like protein (mu-crystallin family)